MRRIYKHCHEGVWFSHNGEKAWQRGEKPFFMWHCPAEDLEHTVSHHIGRTNHRMPGNSCSRELVMFYRKKVEDFSPS